MAPQTGAADELQQMLEIVVQETLEVQEKVAAALETHLSKRRWNWRWCSTSPALELPARSTRLRGLMKEVGRQGSAWQERAAGAVGDALFRARLQALPPEITALIARRVGPIMRRASHSMLALYGPLDATLHLTTAAMSDLHLLGPPAASPTPARLAPTPALDFSALEAGLQQAALRFFPRLRSLQGYSPADLAALAPLAPTLTSLSLAPTSPRTHGFFAAATTLTSLRSLTLLLADVPAPSPPASPPAPHAAPAGPTPAAWTTPLAALPHLRSLSLTLPSAGHLSDPNVWLPHLAALSRLEHVSLTADTPTPLRPSTLALLADSWPAAPSVALCLDTRRLPRPAQAALTTALTTTLAARTTLASLALAITAARRLQLTPPEPPHDPLLALPALRSLSLCLPSTSPLPLQAALAAATPSLTRLVLADPTLVLRPLLPADLDPPRASLLAALSLTLATRNHLATALRLLATLPHLRHLRVRLPPEPHPPADPWAAALPLLAALPPLATLHLTDDATALPPALFSAVACLPSLHTLALESAECVHGWGQQLSPSSGTAGDGPPTPPSRTTHPSHCVVSESTARPLTALTALTALTLAGPGFHYRASGLQLLRRLPALHTVQLQLRCPAPDDAAQRLHDGLLPLPRGLRRLALVNYSALRVPPDVRLALRRAAARQDCFVLTEVGRCRLPEL